MELEEDPPSGDLQPSSKRPTEASMDPWRKFSSKDLKANTIVFPATPRLKVVDYVDSLENHGISAEKILSVQVSTASQCRITFSCNTIVDTITGHGFILNGSLVLPQPLAGPKSLQLHLHDIPVWVPDCVVEAALSLYGTVIGPIRHGRVKIRAGVYVASGVRFASFKQAAPMKAIPSYITTRDGKSTFRAYHTGQKATCRLCGSTDHIAKACGRAKPESQRQHQNETQGSNNAKGCHEEDREPTPHRNTTAAHTHTSTTTTHSSVRPVSHEVSSSAPAANLQQNATSVESEHTTTTTHSSVRPVSHAGSNSVPAVNLQQNATSVESEINAGCSASPVGPLSKSSSSHSLASNTSTVIEFDLDQEQRQVSNDERDLEDISYPDETSTEPCGTPASPAQDGESRAERLLKELHEDDQGWITQKKRKPAPQRSQDTSPTIHHKKKPNR